MMFWPFQKKCNTALNAVLICTRTYQNFEICEISGKRFERSRKIEYIFDTPKGMIKLETFTDDGNKFKIIVGRFIIHLVFPSIKIKDDSFCLDKMHVSDQLQFEMLIR